MPFRKIDLIYRRVIELCRAQEILSDGVSGSKLLVFITGNSHPDFGLYKRIDDTLAFLGSCGLIKRKIRVEAETIPSLMGTSIFYPTFLGEKLYSYPYVIRIILYAVVGVFLLVKSYIPFINRIS